jgi:hypothetical protein
MQPNCSIGILSWLNLTFGQGSPSLLPFPPHQTLYFSPSPRLVPFPSPSLFCLKMALLAVNCYVPACNRPALGLARISVRGPHWRRGAHASYYPHSYENFMLARIAIEQGIGARTSLMLLLSSRSGGGQPEASLASQEPPLVAPDWQSWLQKGAKLGKARQVKSNTIQGNNMDW